MSRDVHVGPYMVGDNHPCFVVGEIGINHNGFTHNATRLMEITNKAGAQAVKFQKRTVSDVYTKNELAMARSIPPENGILRNAVQRGVLSEKSVKRLKQSQFTETTNEDLKLALEFTYDEYTEIDRYAEKLGILWFAAPWDVKSVSFLERFNPPCYKIASACLTDDELLKSVKSSWRPVILSTGMSSVSQIDHAVEVLGDQNLILLHCVSTYPARDEEINLSVISFLRERYDVPVGYSGHEKGILHTLCAVALGACMVERHVTLDRTMWGSDQAASLEPNQFAEIIANIQAYQIAKGDGTKKILESEIPIIEKLRRVK